MIARGKETGVGVDHQIIEIHEVLVMLTSATLEIMVGVTDEVQPKKTEEIIDTTIPSAIDLVIARLAPSMIVGQSLGITVGQRQDNPIIDQEVVVAAVLIDGRKLTGRFLLLEMSDWRWNYLALVIPVLTLVNMRISQLRLLETIYLHTSHL